MQVYILGCRVRGQGEASSVGSRMEAGFRVQGLGFRVYGVGFGV